MNDAISERLFDGPIAEEYGVLARICPAAADMSRRVGDFVAAWNPSAAAPLNVLEIGCGTGVTTWCLIRARPDLRITAVDNAPAMLAQARRNLADLLDAGRVRLVENDALSYLRELPAASVDLVASGYTLHNFLDAYRSRVLEEIHRVLRPGGVFVNGDRYGLDDTLDHLRLIQDEVRHYFRVFGETGRPDLLEQWIVHLFSDESPDHVMRLEPALERMRTIGFREIAVRHRAEVNALVSAEKAGP